MGVYTIYYYPVCYGERIVRDENLPIVDKIFSITKEGLDGDVFKLINFTVYRWDRIFIVKHSVGFLHEATEEDLFLTVLTVDHKRIAIVDWIDLTCMSVFILPSYFLSDYLENLIKKGWRLFLVFQNDIEKEKRRFGVDFSGKGSEWTGIGKELT
jgi:hypothetical protein